MNLYVMRHGDASPVGGAVYEDAQRPLSPVGQAQVRAVAEGIKRRPLVIDVVVSSPLKRAHETARIVAEVMKIPKVDTTPALAPSGSPARLLQIVMARPDAAGLLLVGHHPDVTLWTAFLSGLDPSASPLFSTASIAALQLDLSKKKADFLWFQTSDQLSQP